MDWHLYKTWSRRLRVFKLRVWGIQRTRILKKPSPAKSCRVWNRRLRSPTKTICKSRTQRVDEGDTSEHSHSSQKEIHDAKHFASPRDLEAVHSFLSLNDWCGKQTPASSGPVMTSVCFADENLKPPDIFGRDRAEVFFWKSPSFFLSFPNFFPSTFYFSSALDEVLPLINTLYFQFIPGKQGCCD